MLPILFQGLGLLSNPPKLAFACLRDFECCSDVSRYQVPVALREVSTDLWRDIVLEREAHRRGIEGWDEPLYYQGKLTGHTIRKRSDRILMMLYERHCGRAPEVRVNMNTAPIAIVQRATNVKAWLEADRDMAEDANFEPDAL